MNSEKCLKIICTYNGPRRHTHNTPTDIKLFLKEHVQNEINLDFGYPTDILIVNNSIEDAEFTLFLDSFADIKTANGAIKVVSRPNYFGPFGAYYHAFDLYKDQYMYWFFCEDDVLIYEPGYIKQFIDYLNSDPTLGFVSLAPIATYPQIHSGGGVGLTSTEKFLASRDYDYISGFVNSERVLGYGELENNEVEFTNKFIRSGFKILNHPDCSPFCSNYNRHFGQLNHINEKVNLKKIYRVGN